MTMIAGLDRIDHDRIAEYKELVSQDLLELTEESTVIGMTITGSLYHRT
tara:strand:+ start:742 stop:888 length:147 start_codon:yes stop_codon:yes gene_type:complete